MTIEYMKVDHLTFDYPQHYCINIVGPDENIIFTADMDFNKMELLKKVYDEGTFIHIRKSSCDASQKVEELTYRLGL